MATTAALGVYPTTLPATMATAGFRGAVATELTAYLRAKIAE